MVVSAVKKTHIQKHAEKIVKSENYEYKVVSIHSSSLNEAISLPAARSWNISGKNIKLHL